MRGNRKAESGDRKKRMKDEGGEGPPIWTIYGSERGRRPETGKTEILNYRTTG
jgi:hypothetical protein